ncbi:MAG: S8 family serine peptidase [Actinobacteria bacterium]|nr:S8 family serine peptidase [Actinomycetota bacterium]
MRRILHFLVVAFVGAAVLPLAAQAGPGGGPIGRSAGGGADGLAALAAGVPTDAAPGDLLDVLVTLDRPATPSLTSRLAALGTTVWTARHIEVAALTLPAARLDALRRLTGVEAVYPNRELHYFDTTERTVQADPAPKPKLPPLPGQPPAGGFGAALPVPNIGVDGKGITVAIVDSGVDFTHPDLAPAMVANVKVTPLGAGGPAPIEGLPNTDTSSGHGTHVAGDVAGRGIASNGAYKGSAPGASLVGIGTGEGLTVHSRGVLQSYDWILENHDKYAIRVVNNSYGGSFQPFDPSEPINRATKKATDAGIVVVFAQGNDGDEMTMNSNATPPWVIAVAAGTQKGGITDFTSGGLEADVVDPLTFDVNDLAGDPRKPLRMGLYHPSVVALGENVVGTKANGTIVPALGLRHDLALPAGEQLRYTIMSGTSMASPELCGIAALILEANPALTPADVKRVLQITGKPIADVPFWKQGYGNADPGAAVALARSLVGQPADGVNRILDEKQAARDGDVLAGLEHPLHTTAWWKQPASRDNGPVANEGGDATVTHKITVEPGTGRLKVNNAGFSLPFVPDPLHAIVVRDAAGKEIGHSDPHLPGGSGTTILDLDLTKMTGLTWGVWTVEVSEAGLAPAGFLGSDEATVAATYAKPGKAEPVSSILPSLPSH